MTSQLDHMRPVAVPGRVGQATAVEQSRAVAEVQAAVIVAQQCPRSVRDAVEAMQEACRQKELADRAFFRMPRGNESVSGASVHLARELARTWGNIQHGITELVRDDAHGQSEMQAWAWDVQTNTRSSSTFIVPHKRDTKKGVKDLTDMQAIYENNANNGARRLREAIFSVLPAWYVEQAKALCQQTIEHGGGKPLAVRIADAVRAFEKLRVTPARIAAKFGCQSVDGLTPTDVAQLAVIFSSIQQGTVTVDDEFPAEVAAGRPSAADITGQPAAPQNVPPAAEQVSPVPAEPDAPGPGTAGGTPRLASSGQVGMIQKQFERLGMAGDDQRDGRVRVVAAIAGRPLSSSKELTGDEARKVKDTLESLRDAADLDGMLAELAMADDPRGDGEPQ